MRLAREAVLKAAPKQVRAEVFLTETAQAEVCGVGVAGEDWVV